MTTPNTTPSAEEKVLEKILKAANEHRRFLRYGVGDMKIDLQKALKSYKKEILEEVKRKGDSMLKVSKDSGEVRYLPGGIPVSRGNTPEDSYYNLGILELLNSLK